MVVFGYELSILCTNRLPSVVFLPVRRSVPLLENGTFAFSDDFHDKIFLQTRHFCLPESKVFIPLL